MRLGVDVAQHQLTWEQLLERVLWAEDTGFDGAWIMDHFKALYGDPKGPCLESWTLLAALGARTTTLRLGTLVAGITYRHPSILAAEAVTVDHVSGGRLELAVGAAWFEDEHRQLGVDFPPAHERARRLDEGVRVMKLLMTEDDASFEGRYYRLDGATYRPRPLQQPHPPLWIGAEGEKLMLPIVGRHADVWHSYAPPSAYERKWRIVADSAQSAGRDPASIMRATNLSISEDWDEVEARAEWIKEHDFGYVIVSWPGEGAGRVEEFLDRIAPLLRG